MRILQNKTVAVVIDIQEKLLHHMDNNQIILQNTLKLIEGLQILDVPMIITQQYTRGLGGTVPQIAEKFSGISYIEKLSFSCYDEPSFRELLSSSGKQNVILCGIESHVCVLQTCIDLIDNGFFPVVVEDCVSSRKSEDKTISIHRMRQEGARITTLESLLFELTRAAGSDTFKNISKLVK